ncbi:hypothetical protein, partial [Caballeronia grimmiae]|uniref:hypothetical protein n=1 Tax=Caballeronia grimmiae TaxID=1071679 RepID=UPI00056379D0
MTVGQFELFVNSGEAKPRAPAGREDARGCGEAALGKLTKFADKQSEVRWTAPDPETGEVLRVRNVEGRDGSNRVELVTYDQDHADLERWLMKQTARRLLFKVEEREKRKRVPYSQLVLAPSNGAPYLIHNGREGFKIEPVPGGKKKGAVFRVINCSRDKIRRSDLAEVWYSDKSQRASFHKLGVCGSVWT